MQLFFLSYKSAFKIRTALNGDIKQNIKELANASQNINYFVLYKNNDLHEIIKIIIIQKL